MHTTLGISIVAFTFLSCESSRSLHIDNVSSCQKSLEGREWEYLRIGERYIVNAEGEKSHAPLLEAIRNRVFPVLSEFWSHAISVRSLKSPLTVRRDCILKKGRCVKERTSTCGSKSGGKVVIPSDLLGTLSIVDKYVNNMPVFRKIQSGAGEEVDFMVLISINDHDRCGSMEGGTIASAYACRWDECDRPLMGSVNICPRAVDPSSEHSIQTLFSTLAHEMTHLFGFNAENFQYMRHILGSPRISSSERKVVYYTCKVVGDTVSVEWDVSPSRTNNLHKYVFPTGIVEGMSRRGVGKKCRCPLDPAVQYSSADVAYCLTHHDECVFVVKTPRVAAMAKWFFNCPEITGAELENQRSQLSCQIIDSHWKQRLFGDEYMTAIAPELHGEVSPITFAFLEDTGWYRMNYAMTTAMVPGAHFGFKAGCAFVGRKCIGLDGSVVPVDHNTKTFCTNKGVVCSPDGTHKVDCHVRTRPLGNSVPGPYRYPIPGYSRMNDFCPVYRWLDDSECSNPQNQMFAKNGWEVFDHASRCLDASLKDKTVAASCVRLHCYESGKEYSIEVRRSADQMLTLAERCKSKDQSIEYGDISFKCLDPRIVCSVRDFAHLGTIDLVPSVPGAVFNDDSREEAQQISNRIYSDFSGPVYYKPGRR
jgi:hypothetical protein